MRRFIPVLLAFACTATLMSLATAQPGAGKVDAAAKDFSNASIVVKMMAFNAKKDGKLTKEEVTDRRLHRLFDLADANKDGVVTREELMVLAAKLETEFGPGGPGGKGPTGKGGFDGPGGPGGKGPKGKGPPPRPGQILPNFIQDQLNLTSKQRTQLDDLQKDVDTKLGKILTEEQRDHLREMQQRGPGGPGGKGPPPK
jgi:EF hand